MKYNMADVSANRGILKKEFYLKASKKSTIKK